MDRYWLLTWTTYGTWLPGDERGFVSPAEDEDGGGARVKHNIPGTPYDRDMPALRAEARQLLRGHPVYLIRFQARDLLDQFLETATFRGWELLAVAIMSNHVHLIVGVPDDPDPGFILGSFKSYGSRALKQAGWKQPQSGTWWTESGSRRKLPSLDAVERAIGYVERQTYPLLIWTARDGWRTPTIPRLESFF